MSRGRRSEETGDIERRRKPTLRLGRVGVRLSARGIGAQLSDLLRLRTWSVLCAGAAGPLACATTTAFARSPGRKLGLVRGPCKSTALAPFDAIKDAP